MTNIILTITGTILFIILFWSRHKYYWNKDKTTQINNKEIYKMILKTNTEHIQKVESWINREINIVIEQNKHFQRYDLARGEGYLSALKKVQAKLQGH